MTDTIVNSAIKKGQDSYNLDKDAKSLGKKLQSLSSRKVDIEAEVQNAERSGAKKRKREVGTWLDEVKEIEGEFKALNDRVQEAGMFRKVFSSCTDDVAKVDQSLKRLMEQSQHFGELCLDDLENKGQRRITTKLFGQKFSEGLEIIKKWLETDEISNIGIYGMAGVGKTTLAKHIHNYFLEKTKFNVYWITVSQVFSIKKMQDDIAKLVKIDLSDADDEDTRANKLSVLLEQSVLVLDDVWGEFDFEKIGVSPGANNCKLILTTRSLDVCKKMRCQREFKVKTLDKNESWELFKHKLGADCDRTLSAEIKEIAKSVAKECAGLALCIVTVAGSMRGIEDIHEWRNALDQLKACSHEGLENAVFPILAWSCSRLNECQKHCFLYCSLYPEDWAIERGELVNLFIGAELMEKRDTRQLEFDQGHTILNQLVRVGLLEETSNWEVECVKMHDLIRDMAIRMTSGNSNPKITENVPRFLVKSKGVEQKKWTEDLDAVSIWGMVKEIPKDMSPKCPKLSTLLFRYGIIETNPDSFFRHMDGLKVLNLKGCEYLTTLPNCVSDVVNLTALILEGCEKLAHVPPLGKLKQLRELNLSDSGIKHIPEGLKELINLETLEMDMPLPEDEIIPKGTLSKLHRLECLIIPLYLQVCDLEVLNKLEVFQGHVSFTDICKPCITSGWPTYYRLLFAESLSVDCDPYLFTDLYPSDNNMKEKELIFLGCNFRRGLDVASLPKDIQRLRFSGCVVEQSDVFQILNSSNELLHLTIKRLDEVEFLWKLSSPPPPPPDELKAIPYGPLQKLEALDLSDLPDLVGFFHYQLPLPPGTFSSLKVVYIKRCHKMRKLFTVQLLQSLTNLTSLGVKDCKELEEIAANGEEARGSGGGGIPPPSTGPTNTLTLPQLSSLSLIGLPRLKNICTATIICNSIGDIRVIKCPNVKRLPLFLPIYGGQPSPPFTLHRIEGQKEWWESLEWDIPNAKITLDPFFKAWRW